MNALTFELHLTEPLLATQPASGEENSATSYSFVPGSMLRGALIAAYKRLCKPKDFLNDATVQYLFYSGAVRYLNAYPFYVLKPHRMLPLPASWRAEKDALREIESSVTDFALDDPITRADLEYKALLQPYCIVSAERAYRYDPERALQIHNASSARNYKDARVSQVFRYEALAAGEILGGVILADDGDFKLVRELLGDTLRLGGSHTAGYGRVEIKNMQEDLNWQETPRVVPSEKDESVDEEEISFAPEPPNVIVVTLLSDVIVRGGNGQAGADFDATLGRALGVPALKHLRAFCAMRWVGGFNRAAGLPLPQEWALCAGSVFVYAVDAFEIPKTELLVARGIGERTVEGFGRIAINYQTEASFTLHKLEPLDNRAPLKMELDATTPVPPLSDMSEKLAREMAGRQLRAKLEQTLIEKINATEWKTDPPKNSQLSRLRTAARNALYAETLQPITDLLNGLKGARKQYDSARVDSQTLWEWLDARLASKLDTFRTEFKIEDTKALHVGGRAPEIKDALRVEYVARWIDGVMQRGQKLNQDEEGQ